MEYVRICCNIAMEMFLLSCFTVFLVYGTYTKILLCLYCIWMDSIIKWCSTQSVNILTVVYGDTLTQIVQWQYSWCTHAAWSYYHDTLTDGWSWSGRTRNVNVLSELLTMVYRDTLTEGWSCSGNVHILPELLWYTGILWQRGDHGVAVNVMCNVLSDLLVYRDTLTEGWSCSSSRRNVHVLPELLWYTWKNGILQSESEEGYNPVSVNWQRKVCQQLGLRLYVIMGPLRVVQMLNLNTQLQCII